MVDYQGNTNKDKELKPKKKIEKVVEGEVVFQKKSLGRKFKDLIIEADFRTVVMYVVTDVMIPAAKNMVVDAGSRGVERLMYGEAAVRRRSSGGYGPLGQRITYNSPINRDPRYTQPGSPRNAPPITTTSRATASGNNIILQRRKDAEEVLDQMGEIIDQYEVVSMADLLELIGEDQGPQDHVNHKWGWIYLGGAKIVQVRDGWLLDLPPAEAIS